MRPELAANPTAWLRLASRTGRLLKNFGDEFSPLAWEFASGRSVEWSAPAMADAFGVGSVLELVTVAQNNPIIWGTGLRHDPRAGDEIHALEGNLRIAAVRGPLTSAGLSLATTPPFGDPGMLIAAMTKHVSPSKRHGKVFVAHFRTWATRDGRHLLDLASRIGYTIVRPSEHPLKVARLIAQSEFVLTSSLHGLIFADALGVPCQLFHNDPSEPTFKFSDYSQSVGLEFEPIGWKEASDPRFVSTNFERLESRAVIVQQSVSQLIDPLIRSIQNV